MSDGTKKETSSLYPAVVGLFVASLLISNIAAQKLIPFGPFVFTAGILLFPITYIFGDILTEVFGFKKARQAIWLGFIANIFMAVFLSIVISLPAAPGWNLQSEFAATLSMVPRVVIASVVGYLVGEYANSVVMAKLKIATNGRHLWLRTVSSTVIGQSLDTMIFATIAFWGVIPNDVLFTAMWSGYLFKVLYEAVATPITYLIVRWLKRREGIDVFDIGTRFSLFR